MFGGAPPSAYHLLGNLVTLTSIAVLAHIQCTNTHGEGGLAPETIGKLPEAPPLEPSAQASLPWSPCPVLTGSPTAWPGPGGAGLLGTGVWPEFSSLSPPPANERRKGLVDLYRGNGD